MKRFLSLFLALMVAVGICFSAPMTIEAEAYVAHSQTEAVSWAKSKVGTKVGAGQCVSLITAYYSYLGVSSVSGDGCDYATNSLPSGWTRIKYYSGFVAQPGDIAVWTWNKWAGNYGHVGIVGSADSSGFTFYDQGASYGYVVNSHSKISYTATNWTFWGVVRPDFSGATPTYTVSYDANGGTGAPAAQTKKAGEKLTLSTTKPTRTGYTFFNWKSSAKGDTYAPGPSGWFSGDYNTTMVAQWTPNTYTISYNANGGSGSMSSQSVTFNTKFNVKTSAFTRSGYKQVGWNLYRTSDSTWFVPNVGWKTASQISSGGYSKQVYALNASNWLFESSFVRSGLSTDTFVFYAVWEKVASYTISYDANGGWNAPSSQTKVHGTNLTLTTDKPTRSGYTFLGWGTSTGDTSVNYEPGSTYSTDASKTLYAIWKKDYNWAPVSENLCFYIRNKATGGWLHPANMNPSSGNRIGEWNVKYDAMKVSVVEDNRGYEIWFPGVTTDYLIGVTMSIIPTDSEVYFQADNHTTWQAWRFEEISSGQYVIRNMYNSDYCLTGKGIGEYSKVEKYTGESNQIWILEPYETFKITYNANGGTGAPEPVTKLCGNDVNLSTVKPTRSGYTFLGWGTSASDTTVDYAPGTRYYKDESITLYAIWQCNHGSIITKNVKSSTCTATGYTGDKYCSSCGLLVSYGSTTAKLVHSTSVINKKSATCTADGYTGDTYCSTCKTTTVNGETIKAKGHKEVTVTGKAATCTFTGLTDGKKCSVCGTVTKAQEIIKAKGHTTSVINKKDATCTADGYTGDTYCSTCKTTTAKGSVIKATGHTEVTVTGKAATCTSTGLTDGKKCSVCGTVTKAQETIKAKGHTTSVINKKSATCTADGYTGDTYCSTCKTTTAKGSTIKSKGHTEVTVTGKAATCTATGLTDGKKCSVCGTVTKAQETIKAKGHTTSVINKKDATCTADGYAGDTYCSTCKTTVTKGKAITKLGHSYNAGEITTKATCEKDGVKTFTCTRCKATKTETIKASGHKEVVIPAVAPTYKEAGKTEGKKCSVCGTVTVAQKEVAKLTLATPVVTVKNSGTGVKVTWNAIDGATSYKVYRKTYSTKTKKYGSWKTCGTVTTTSYVDTKAKSGTKYIYTVKAFNNDTKSDIKNSSSSLYLAQPTVKIANASTGVKVSWNKITGATSYKVYRSEYKNGKWSSWKAMKTISKGSTVSWTDTKAKSGVKYKYTVKAVNGKTASTYKSSNSLLFLAQPKTTVKAVSNGVKVSWTQITGATSYKIYRSEYNTKTKKWSSWKSIKTAKSTSKSYTDKSAKKGVKYRYAVKAVNGKVASTYKASSSVKR